MPAPLETRLRSAALIIFLPIAVVAQPADPGLSQHQVIRIWRVGSPHTGDIPAPTVAARFRREAARHDLRVAVESFPARGFAALFADAVARNLAPDILVFDNFGVMIQAASDPERLSLPWARRDTLTTGQVRACELWRTDRFAVAVMNAAYQGETALGHSRVVLVLVRTTADWRLLAAARDPITVGAFAEALPQLASALQANPGANALPPPGAAVLLSPPPGVFPSAPKGQRFGRFIWQPAASDAVVAEIVEFAYEGDVRLFLAAPSRAGLRSSITAGALWSTKGPWYWRVWSISRTGEIAFSEARTFIH